MSKNEPIKKTQQLDDVCNLTASEIKEYNRDIEIAMNEIDNGKYTSHKEVTRRLLKNSSC